MDNFGYFLLGLTLLLVPLYYVWAWLRVGRDPEKGTIVPLFRPPEGMGAGWACAMSGRQAMTTRAFAASVVGLAVKGRMAIRNSGGGLYD